MSTTVKYKGNTLTTVSNATKTLKTAGKYMEGDVILTDTSAGAATIESLSVTPSELAQTFNASTVDGYKPVSVGAIPCENRIVNPTETETIVPRTEGYYLKTVTVKAISSTYVGSGITRHDSNDVTVSGATVSVPAGYYSTAASKAIDNASLTFNSITNNEPGVASTNNKLTFIADVDVRTAGNSVGGYVASGQQVLGTVRVYLYSDKSYFYDNSGLTTSGATVTVPEGYYANQVTKSVASGSATAPASISGTAASISTGTNTLTLTKTVSVTPTVSAGYISAGTAGNSSVSLTASVTTKAAATITPTTTNQTIAAGTYLTGTQTIVGDADLVASNIISTANIFGVQGSVVVQSYYTGSSAPASSLGQNGDIYLQE